MTMRFARLCAATALAACPAVALLAGQSPSTPLTITVVSGRPDMITGGDARLRVAGSLSVTNVTANGQTLKFEPRPRRAEDEGVAAVEGVVSGLPLGKTTLTVRSGGRTGTLDVTNYPGTGPVFSGPHQKPFACQTEAWKLGPPLDANCSAPTKVEYHYKSTAPVQGRGASAFKPLANPAERPADLAQTTVNGRTVPYIVKVETGVINRAVYQIAMLEGAWNERLVYTFGGGCMAGYVQGANSGGVLNDVHLSRGFAVASSSLNVFNNNCNGSLSAETLMMVKERFIESVGVPKHTIGWGGSGGAMAQYEIGQNYPGLLDGIIPSATFPDAVSYFINSEDCRLLLRPYLNKTTLTEEQKRAITGMSMWGTCNNSYAGRPGRLTPTDCDSDIPKELRYDPVTNPTGARCSIYDGMAAVFGRDPKTGFARRPHDNVGVQYGLAALNDGTISKEVFLDLNEKVGGFDIDTNWQAERTVGDPEAIRIVYAKGKMNQGTGGLRDIPIIDARGYVDLDANFHESYHSFKARARLIKANGDADNQVMLRASSANMTRLQGEYLEQMDRWLSNIAADRTRIAQHAKVVKAKPADLVDACWDANGQKIADPAVYGKDSPCNKLFPPHSAPRLVAGATLADDVWKCQLKPIDVKDYKVTFSSDELARLKKIFPTGVCDWSKPSQHQAPFAGTWPRY